MPNPRRVDSELLHRTVAHLERRIGQHFPEAGLRNVALNLIDLSEDAKATSRHIGRPIYLLRVPIALLLIVVTAVLMLEVFFIHRLGEFQTIVAFIQILEPTLGSLFFMAAIVAFLLSLETRWKRTRALDAIHELRAMAHVVDLHQLTKDPTDPQMGETRVQPDNRPLTPEELTRYLDFCGEMLSLLSKMAVLYIQEFPDTVAVNAVDEIEGLTNGIDRKIWQKIMLIRQEHPSADSLAAKTAVRAQKP